MPRPDAIYREGEEPWCGIEVMSGIDHTLSHAAMHRRSEVVARAAIESSKRGDGRFLEGPGDMIVELTLGLATFHGAMVRVVRAAEDFAQSWDAVDSGFYDDP